MRSAVWNADPYREAKANSLRNIYQEKNIREQKKGGKRVKRLKVVDWRVRRTERYIYS